MFIDLLKFIIHPKYNETTCFLCFTQKSSTISVHEKIAVVNKYSETTLSLSEMVKDLFPEHEMISTQACDNCMDLIINMYATLQKNKLKKFVMGKIIDILHAQLYKKTDCYTKNNLNKKIQLYLPKYEDVLLKSTSKKVSDPKNCTEPYMRHKNLSKNEDKELSLKEQDYVIHKNVNEAAICEVCGKTFKSSISLRAHLNCHREKQCPYCFKYLKSHSHFRLHIKKHEKPYIRLRNKTYYKCHHCNYKSVNKKTLEAHINKTHLSVRPYVCGVCFKGFYKKSNLTQHEVTHSNLKNEMCEVCGENFVSKKTLLIHLKLHLEEKLFECSSCDKRFVTSGHRLEHFKRNHEERSECCRVCGKRYGLKRDLTRHMKRVHSLCNIEMQS